MDGRIISQPELDVLLNEELSLQQASHIFRILLILSEFVFLSTEMLMQLYLEQYGEKMGLSYLKRAVRNKLIIEYKENLDTSFEKNIFFYMLKPSTIYYLQNNRIPCIKMPVSTGLNEKSRLLTFISYAIQSNIKLDKRVSLDLELRYFITSLGTVFYFPNCIDAQQLLAIFKSEETEKIQIQEIPIPLIEIGKHTRAVHPKDVE